MESAVMNADDPRECRLVEAEDARTSLRARVDPEFRKSAQRARHKRRHERVVRRRMASPLSDHEPAGRSSCVGTPRIAPT